jgi:hypothetical protein
MHNYQCFRMFLLSFPAQVQDVKINVHHVQNREVGSAHTGVGPVIDGSGPFYSEIILLSGTGSNIFFYASGTFISIGVSDRQGFDAYFLFGCRSRSGSDILCDVKPYPDQDPASNQAKPITEKCEVSITGLQ